MATKFIPLDEAAKMLGIPADELKEMGQKGEIHALRDGPSLKFKPEEISRVAEERGITLGTAGSSADENVEFDAPGLLAVESSDLDLSSEGKEPDGAPTAIGTAEDLAGLLGGSGISLDSEGKKPAGGPGKTKGAKPTGSGSQVDLDADGGSAVNIGGESSADVLSGSDVASRKASGSRTGELGSDEGELGMASDLTLSDDEELALGGESKPAAGEGGGDDLALGDEDELVLDGGSDVTRGAGDTGINLISTSDSGLNLEEVPLDLAGSAVGTLELPEDDEVQLDDLDAGPDEATKLRADEEFQLEPAGAGAAEDAEDSGSQVIALEDSEAFATPAGAVATGEEAVLGATGDELEGALAAEEAQPVMAGAAMVYAPLPEMPYSVWNVLSLLGILVVLTLTGMLMTDLVRNMWTWDQTFSATTPVMDTLVRMFGLEP
jgi:hypothetical protein